MESTATGSSASSSQHPSRIPLPDLEALLTSTIKKRSDHYTTITALLVSWETDDTGAQADSTIFEKTLSEKLRSIMQSHAGLWRPDINFGGLISTSI